MKFYSKSTKKNTKKSEVTQKVQKKMTKKSSNIAQKSDCTFFLHSGKFITKAVGQLSVVA